MNSEEWYADITNTFEFDLGYASRIVHFKPAESEEILRQKWLARSHCRLELLSAKERTPEEALKEKNV